MGALGADELDLRARRVAGAEEARVAEGLEDGQGARVDLLVAAGEDEHRALLRAERAAGERPADVAHAVLCAVGLGGLCEGGRDG